MVRGLHYYFDIICLRCWAYFYLITDFINPKRGKKLKQSLISSFDKGVSKSKLALFPNDPFYYTYAFFSSPSDFEQSLIKNSEGLVINPTTLQAQIEKPGLLFPAYYGLVCCNHYYKINDPKQLATIHNHARFVQDHIGINGEIEIWQDWPMFQLKAPYYTGITQAIVASFLMRAHKLFPEDGYDLKIKSIIDFMLDSTIEKKMLVTSLDGLPWIEEYPMNPPSMVLNGFIFSIISLYEYSSFSSDFKYKIIAEELTTSMVHSLYRYLYPIGIKHNVYQNKFGNINYQALHTYQFLHLYKLTGNKLFLDLFLKYHHKVNWYLFCKFYNMKYKNKKFNPKKFL